MSLRDVSKYMSLILRHKPETIGINLDEHGWANVQDLIAKQTNLFLETQIENRKLR